MINFLDLEKQSNCYFISSFISESCFSHLHKILDTAVLYDCGEHSNVLNLLGISEFRLAMFLDSADRLIYFRNKKSRIKTSLIELASGI